MTVDASEDAEVAYPPFMSPTAVRRMSVAVVVMGVILLVGFATLVGLIIYKSGQAKKAEIARSKPAVVSPADARRIYSAGGTAAFIEAKIPKGARITGMRVNGNRVFLTIEDESGSSLMLFDAKDWKVLGVARFTEDAGQ
ncbi:MAG: hypothetical protein ACR2O4_06810 [Hyphomicrobiaceae bacterium]